MQIPALSQWGAFVKSHEQPLVIRRVVETDPFGRTMKKCDLHGAVEVGFEAVDGDLETARLLAAAGASPFIDLFDISIPIKVSATSGRCHKIKLQWVKFRRFVLYADIAQRRTFVAALPDRSMVKISRPKLC